MKNDQLDDTNPTVPLDFMFDHSKWLNHELLASFDKMNSEFIRENNSDYFPVASKMT